MSQRIDQRLGHVLTPLITPFLENGDINYDLAGKMANDLVDKKFTDTIIVGGTTGEFNTQTAEERMNLMKAVKDAVGGRVPLMAGTGAASTRESIRLTQYAEKLGYDAVMVVAPMYCKPTQEGIYRHYKAIAESTSLPLLLYNIPIFTGVNIDPDTVARLAEIDNIVGIKEEAGINATQTTDYMLATPDDFIVYDGDDIMVLPTLVQGAVGVVSGGSHLVGDRMKTMIKEFLAGNVRKAIEIHMEIYPLFKAFCPNGRVHPNPVLRAAVEMIGYPVGPARMPLDQPTEEEKANIRRILQRLQLI